MPTYSPLFLQTEVDLYLAHAHKQSEKTCRLLHPECLQFCSHHYCEAVANGLSATLLCEVGLHKGNAPKIIL